MFRHKIVAGHFFSVLAVQLLLLLPSKVKSGVLPNRVVVLMHWRLCNVVLAVLFLSGVQAAGMLCGVVSGSSVCSCWTRWINVGWCGCGRVARENELQVWQQQEALRNHGRLEQSDKNDKNERKIFPGKCLWTPWAPARIEDRARKQLFTDMLFFFLKKTNFVYIQVLVHTMMSNREITNGLFKY